MNNTEINTIFERLRENPENEVIEFKEAKNNFDFSKLGKYFPALSNEANLQNKPFAWLIFGVEDKRRKIVGTNYRQNRKDLDKLKKEIADKVTNRITFIEIFDLPLPEGRVIMFQIPPALKGIPIAFEGQYYGRDGESLAPLNIEKIERIRYQSNTCDWSKEIISQAVIADLDEQAIAKARIEFVKRNPKFADEIQNWNDAKFLNKAKLTIHGKITRACFLLLGKEEQEHYLDSAIKIRWNLKTLTNQDKDFEIFSIPLILAVDEVYKKIRNLKYRYLQEGTLFPDEVLRYDPFVIRESLNNAIAHQDYTKKARINVVEFEDDHLIFTNYGIFLPGSVENVVLKDAPEEIYRNPFLVEAMRNLGMIETQGGGICKMFNFQRQRFFPMPDYDFSDGKVKNTITGRIINEDFARILAKNPKLPLDDVLTLDKVQKQIPISEDEIKYIRKKKFIEGRKSNIYLSYKVVKPTEDENLMAEYVSNKSFDDEYFKDMIYNYIKLQGKVKRSVIDKLIIPKLSAVLSEEQKKKKVENLLTKLRQQNKIKCTESRNWEIVK
ncbi:MAG: putative DNA binding domain-containing protein [Planctomycetaceae bacterium]|jgi:ATP-dependent DNA helicase RecG|nr:putative DNA binding domain-containing protein [Planctomycetaceae bacterium]